MRNYDYCPFCGNLLRVRFIEAQNRKTCTACDWIYYRNPLPVVACLVLSPEKELLLIKRGIEPCIGEWALPGGFIELSESPQGAGERELKEETGLDGKAGRFIGVYTQESQMYGSVLIIGVEYAVKKGNNVTSGDDAMDAKFFPLDTLPEVPFQSHHQLIVEFLSL